MHRLGLFRTPYPFRRSVLRALFPLRGHPAYHWRLRILGSISRFVCTKGLLLQLPLLRTSEPLPSGWCTSSYLLVWPAATVSIRAFVGEVAGVAIRYMSYDFCEIYPMWYLTSIYCYIGTKANYSWTIGVFLRISLNVPVPVPVPSKYFPALSQILNTTTTTTTTYYYSRTNKSILIPIRLNFKMCILKIVIILYHSIFRDY